MLTVNPYDPKVVLKSSIIMIQSWVDNHDEINALVDVRSTEEVDDRVDVPVLVDKKTEVDSPNDTDPDATLALERDKNGRVWDERIDSGNRKLTTAGEWMKRKNVSDEVRKTVIAELMAVAPSPEKTFETAAAPAAPVAPAPPTTIEPPVVDVPDQPAGTAPEWGVVFQRTMAAQMNQTVNQEQIDAKVAEFGIEGGFPGLIAHPDKYEQFMMELQIP